MLALQKKRDKSLIRHRQPKAIVRSGHEAMTRDTGAAETPLYEETFEPSWDGMVFEHRNRDYGAYVVRKNYASNVVIGVAATLLIVAVVLAWPSVAKWIGGQEKTVDAPPRKLVYTELSAPPPIDKPKPPPPAVQIPRLQKVVKFVPPRVVKEHVTEIMPAIQELKLHDTGTEEADGPAEVHFDEPVADLLGADDELFTVVDQQPEYAGGYDAMIAFIKANMQYPANARKMRIEGTVHVSFIVDKTGAISDVKVLRGIMTECDREAVRVVNMMPLWIPGKQNGRPVNVRFILPLKFKLS